MRQLAAALIPALILLPSPAHGAGPLQRYALVVGANSGGAGRPQLRYAISDAERFARVLVEIGGVAPGDEIVLRQPKVGELVAAIDRLTERVAAARRLPSAGGRTEVVVYYSGHADSQGLLLGDDRYSYLTLRDRLDNIPADVRIAVLDACSSGSFTRIKGGKARPPFLVDESSNMRGHAFLTSSAESEVAQESDRIGASYFTHFLVSGFRGAADLSGDGRVTLSEAYQFAFNETLGRTVDTRGGAQHPSYDINLSGTGDVVMTDVRQTTATLVLDARLEGRFFVYSAAKDLVAELYKPAGRNVELAVEPGAYEIRVERARTLMIAKAQVGEEARVVLDASQLVPSPMEPTTRRGDADRAPEQRFAVAGRHRLEVMGGTWRKGDNPAAITAGASTLDVIGGIAYTRYVREDLAMNVGVERFGTESGAIVGPRVVASGTVSGTAIPIVLRWNPLRGDHSRQPLKPFVETGLGPVFGSSNGSLVSPTTISTGTSSRATIFARFGGGLDIHVARSFSLGMDAGYNVMRDFSESLGLRDNFNGLHIALSAGWLFGKGY
jgi:Caspase domain